MSKVETPKPESQDVETEYVAEDRAPVQNIAPVPAKPANTAIPEAVQKVAPSTLKPHPQNVHLYGDESIDEEFSNSIRDTGISAPIIVNSKMIIISGHRRWKASLHLKLPEVPIIVRDFGNELIEQLALLDANSHRRKTNYMLGLEIALRRKIEADRAKERQKQATRANKGSATQTRGKTRDIVGEAVGLSGPSVDRLLEVMEAIEKLMPKKTADAKKLTDYLNKSINAGHNCGIKLGVIKAKGKASGEAKSKLPAATASSPPVSPYNNDAEHPVLTNFKQVMACVSKIHAYVEDTLNNPIPKTELDTLKAKITELSATLDATKAADQE